MSVGTEPQPETAAIDDPPYLITSGQFFEMIEAGVFPEEARVYLREGRIVEKMARTRSHSLVAAMIHEGILRRLPDGWKVFSEAQFQLDDKNAVLPDLAVVRAESYRSLQVAGAFPSAFDLALVVEIAVTSLTKDLGPNLRRYARSMIPCYWVVDVLGKRILAHSQPAIHDGQAGYEQVLIVRASETVPLVLAGQEVTRFTYEDLIP